MRQWLLATVLAYSTVGFCASETVSDAPSIVDMSETAQGVAISAIPAPFPVIEVLKLDDQAARKRAARKLQQARKMPAPTILLSRTERRQVALLTASKRSSGQHDDAYDTGGDNQSGLDDLVLHRSFSRPRVVEESENEKARADELPDHIRLRLMMARLKAVEALALNQVQDAGEALPESVLSRLKEARLKAVEVHQRKFG
ncbi:MAG: hypothetical protein JNJ95_05160 [Dechloromonas sp.]|nr:hypothetical protein [Dechloromonas sp.]